MSDVMEEDGGAVETNRSTAAVGKIRKREDDDTDEEERGRKSPKEGTHEDEEAAPVLHGDLTIFSIAGGAASGGSGLIAPMEAEAMPTEEMSSPSGEREDDLNPRPHAEGAEQEEEDYESAESISSGQPSLPSGGEDESGDASAEDAEDAEDGGSLFFAERELTGHALERNYEHWQKLQAEGGDEAAPTADEAIAAQPVETPSASGGASLEDRQAAERRRIAASLAAFEDRQAAERRQIAASLEEAGAARASAPLEERKEAERRRAAKATAAQPAETSSASGGASLEEQHAAERRRVAALHHEVSAFEEEQHAAERRRIAALHDEVSAFEERQAAERRLIAGSDEVEGGAAAAEAAEKVGDDGSPLPRARDEVAAAEAAHTADETEASRAAEVTAAQSAAKSSEDDPDGMETEGGDEAERTADAAATRAPAASAAQPAEEPSEGDPDEMEMEEEDGESKADEVDIFCKNPVIGGEASAGMNNAGLVAKFRSRDAATKKSNEEEKAESASNAWAARSQKVAENAILRVTEGLADIPGVNQLATNHGRAVLECGYGGASVTTSASSDGGSVIYTATSESSDAKERVLIQLSHSTSDGTVTSDEASVAMITALLELDPEHEGAELSPPEWAACCESATARRPYGYGVDTFNSKAQKEGKSGPRALCQKCPRNANGGAISRAACPCENPLMACFPPRVVTTQLTMAIKVQHDTATRIHGRSVHVMVRNDKGEMIHATALFSSTSQGELAHIVFKTPSPATIGDVLRVALSGANSAGAASGVNVTAVNPTTFTMTCPMDSKANINALCAWGKIFSMKSWAENILDAVKGNQAVMLTTVVVTTPAETLGSIARVAPNAAIFVEKRDDEIKRPSTNDRDLKHKIRILTTSPELVEELVGKGARVDTSPKAVIAPRSVLRAAGGRGETPKRHNEWMSSFHAKSKMRDAKAKFPATKGRSFWSRKRRVKKPRRRRPRRESDDEPVNPVWKANNAKHAKSATRRAHNARRSESLAAEEAAKKAKEKADEVTSRLKESETTLKNCLEGLGAVLQQVADALNLIPNASQAAAALVQATEQIRAAVAMTEKPTTETDGVEAANGAEDEEKWRQRRFQADSAAARKAAEAQEELPPGRKSAGKMAESSATAATATREKRTGATDSRPKPRRAESRSGGGIRIGEQHTRAPWMTVGPGGRIVRKEREAEHEIGGDANGNAWSGGRANEGAGAKRVRLSAPDTRQEPVQNEGWG